MTAEGTVSQLGDARPPSQAARLALSAILLGVGAAHFARPSSFDAIIPKSLPSPRFWTYSSGVAELSLGSALLVRPSPEIGWAVVALLAAVFPANVNQAMNSVQIPGAPELPRWVMWTRLPLQPIMMKMAIAATRRSPRPRQ